MITPEQLAASGSEDGHQLALMCWCALNFEKYPELKRLVAIPNGGFRDKREAAKLKAMGVKRGFPDLGLFVRRGEYSALFIELKKPKNKTKAGKTNDEQDNWLEYLRTQGFGTIVCTGWEQARDTLIKYLEWK